MSEFSRIFVFSPEPSLAFEREKKQHRYFFKRLHRGDDERRRRRRRRRRRKSRLTETHRSSRRTREPVVLLLLLLSREEGAKREGKREGGVSTARSRKVDGVLDLKKNERTNERGEKKKKERRRYLNVQIVARGNDASFGASDFRHRAWSDRDRRRHRQRYSWCCSRSSLSLSRVVIGMKRGGAQNPQNLRVQFSKNKTNPKLLSEKKGVGHRETTFTTSHLRRGQKLWDGFTIER